MVQTKDVQKSHEESIEEHTDRSGLSKELCEGGDPKMHIRPYKRNHCTNEACCQNTDDGYKSDAREKGKSFWHFLVIIFIG